MNVKITINSNAIVVTNLSDNSVIKEWPLSQTWFQTKALDLSNQISLYRRDSSDTFTIDITKAFQEDGVTAFTPSTFRTLAYENFNTASGGSGASGGISIKDGILSLTNGADLNNPIEGDVRMDTTTPNHVGIYQYNNGLWEIMKDISAEKIEPSSTYTEKSFNSWGDVDTYYNINFSELNNELLININGIYYNWIGGIITTVDDYRRSLFNPVEFRLTLNNSNVLSHMIDEPDRIISDKAIEVPVGTLYIGKNSSISAAVEALNYRNDHSNQRSLLLHQEYDDERVHTAHVNNMTAVQNVIINNVNTESRDTTQFTFTVTSGRKLIRYGYIKSDNINTLQHLKVVFRTDSHNGDIIYVYDTDIQTDVDGLATLELASPIMLDEGTVVYVSVDFDSMQGAILGGEFFPVISIGVQIVDYKNIISEELFADTKQYSGVVDRTESSLSFVDNIVTLNVPIDMSYHILSNKKHIINDVNVNISNVEGLHYIYLDIDGVLHETTTFNFNTLFYKNAYIAVCYWDVDNQKIIYFGDERHGSGLNPTVHEYLHTVFGSQFISGGGLDNFTIGDGSSDTHVQFSYGSAIFRDEDIKHEIPTSPTIARIPIYYREGLNNIRVKEADNFPLIGKDDITLTSRPKINTEVGGVYSLVEVPVNDLFLVHYFLTNDHNNPVIGWVGTTSYNNMSLLDSNVIKEINGLSGLPFTEFLPIGSVIYGSDSYTNTPNAKILQTSSLENYIDTRNFRNTSSGINVGVAQSHNNLTGREVADCHPVSAITNFSNEVKESLEERTDNNRLNNNAIYTKINSTTNDLDITDKTDYVNSIIEIPDTVLTDINITINANIFSVGDYFKIINHSNVKVNIITNGGLIVAENSIVLPKLSSITIISASLNRWFVVNDHIYNTLSNGSIPIKVDDILIDSGIIRRDDGTLLAPENFGVESGSIKFADIVKMSEVSGFMAVKSFLSGNQYNLVDAKFRKDGISFNPTNFHLNEAEKKFTTNDNEDVQFMDQTITFLNTTTLTSQVNRMVLKAFDNISNLKIKIEDVSTGLVLKYIPSIKSFENDNVDGLNFTIPTPQEIEIDFEDTQLRFDPNTEVRITIKSDNNLALLGGEYVRSLPLGGTETINIPYLKWWLQEGEEKELAYKEDVNDTVTELYNPSFVSRHSNDLDITFGGFKNTARIRKRVLSTGGDTWFQSAETVTDEASWNDWQNRESLIYN